MDIDDDDNKARLRIVSEALVKLVRLYELEYDNPERPDWLQDALHIAEESNE